MGKFNQQKKSFLNKKDKSKKGSIDKAIQPLINKINQKENYFTTSSCSGRIVVYRGKNKKEVQWLFTTHQPTSLQEIKKIKPSQETAWLRSEGAILHVSCLNLKAANQLLQKAKKVFKKSSILSASNKIIVEISSSEILETPIIKNNQFLVNDKYLSFLVKEANKKLKTTREKIKKLKMLL